jgi:hypothetical protein
MTTATTTITPREASAIITTVQAIGGVIKDAGEAGIPSGHLYAMVMSAVSLNSYQRVIDLDRSQVTTAHKGARTPRHPPHSHPQRRPTMTTATATQATPTTATQPRLERENCSRCAGTGHYSYCPSYGTTCFRCAGRKLTYTRRGEAARSYLVALRSRRLDTLVPGDQVRHSLLTMGGDSYTAAFTVASIEPYTDRGSSLKDGVMVPYEHQGLKVELTSYKAGEATIYGPADQSIECIYYKAVQIEMLGQAIAYQDTLTQAGTVRRTRTAATVKPAP